MCSIHIQPLICLEIRPFFSTKLEPFLTAHPRTSPPPVIIIFPKSTAGFCIRSKELTSECSFIGFRFLCVHRPCLGFRFDVMIVYTVCRTRWELFGFCMMCCVMYLVEWPYHEDRFRLRSWVYIVLGRMTLTHETWVTICFTIGKRYSSGLLVQSIHSEGVKNLQLCSTIRLKEMCV